MRRLSTVPSYSVSVLGVRGRMEEVFRWAASGEAAALNARLSGDAAWCHAHLDTMDAQQLTVRAPLPRLVRSMQPQGLHSARLRSHRCPRARSVHAHRSHLQMLFRSCHPIPTAVNPSLNQRAGSLSSGKQCLSLRYYRQLPPCISHSAHSALSLCAGTGPGHQGGSHRHRTGAVEPRRSPHHGYTRQPQHAVAPGHPAVAPRQPPHRAARVSVGTPHGGHSRGGGCGQ